MSDQKLNRIDRLFELKRKDILSVYFTAGFPALNDTLSVLNALQESGADIAEIGMPFSDPVADGPTIQEANEQALKNGMNMKLMFEQLKNMRPKISIPVILMGYINPVLQYGISEFCESCLSVGVDGLILPDLPPELYEQAYKDVFDRSGIKNILLITPQSSDERIRKIDSLSGGFVYAVSSSAVTGGNISFDQSRKAYLTRLQSLKLKNPILVGFGVSTRADCEQIAKHANGVIVGSAFIRALSSGARPAESAAKFVKGILHDNNT